jgi:hypothetical protein
MDEPRVDNLCFIHSLWTWQGVFKFVDVVESLLATAGLSKVWPVNCPYSSKCIKLLHGIARHKEIEDIEHSHHIGNFNTNGHYQRGDRITEGSFSGTEVGVRSHKRKYCLHDEIEVYRLSVSVCVCVCTRVPSISFSHLEFSLAPAELWQYRHLTTDKAKTTGRCSVWLGHDPFPLHFLRKRRN